MATGRVQAEFFHTRAQPAGLDPLPEPGSISKWIFLRAQTSPAGSMGLVGPRYFRAHSVAQKKKFCLILIFSATKQVGEKEHKKIQI